MDDTHLPGRVSAMISPVKAVLNKANEEAYVPGMGQQRGDPKRWHVGSCC